MKKRKLFFTKYFSSLDLNDCFLFVFMIILMIQTTYNLFMNESVGNKSAIDTALRTTTAGIFGYYMGKGFMRGTLHKNNSQKKIPIPHTFKIGEDIHTPLPQVALIDDDRMDEIIMRQNIQTVIVGSLGILSLIILIITRNASVITVEKTATLSQLRDFVSGSTGFLISQSRK